MSSPSPGAAPRGAFILLEGPDRSGKTSQARLLVERLCASGRRAVFMNFPNRTTAVGQMINAYLTNKVDTDDRAIHLLFAANRWEGRDRIVRTLEEGTHIVMDRYSFSGTAFSSAKGLDREWCFAPERGLPAPDAVAFLSITPEEAEKRGDYGEERYEKVEFQRRVGVAFEELRRGRGWHVVQAARTRDEVHADVAAVAEKAIAEVVAGRALGQL